MNSLSRVGRSVAIGMALCAVSAPAPAASPAPGTERFYIGTYSGVIYQSTLSLTGAFGLVRSAATVASPSFLAFTPDRKFLYAVNESGGTVVAYSVIASNG